MNRKRIVSILAFIMVISMVLTVLLGALPIARADGVKPFNSQCGSQITVSRTYMRNM